MPHFYAISQTLLRPLHHGRWISLPAGRPLLSRRQWQRFDTFRRLTPEQRERAREIYSRHWQSLPPERRRAVLDEFRRLRTLSPEERARRLARPDLAEQFNPEERELLRELSTL